MFNEKFVIGLRLNDEPTGDYLKALSAIEGVRSIVCTWTRSPGKAIQFDSIEAAEQCITLFGIEDTCGAVAA